MIKILVQQARLEAVRDHCSALAGDSASVKARKFIADAFNDPAELKAIGKAFDNAWDKVAPQVSTRPEAIEAARLKLADRAEV